MSRPEPILARSMPEPAPLEMPAQRFDRSVALQAPERPHTVPRLARLFLFGFAGLATLGLALVFADWFRADGINALEATVIGLGTFTFFWIALSVAMALLGCLPTRRTNRGGQPLRTAILLPIYGEPVSDITANIRAMLEDLDRTPTDHSFELFVLSDRRDPEVVLAEQRMVASLRRRYPNRPIWYRHRPENTRYKAGNIEDWVTRHGAAYEAMLVLDADSVMTGPAMVELADTLAADPAAGLIQTIPRLAGGESLFARLQQFSNTVYGTTLARGLARWTGDEANYWGHNAILRTRAFAASAGLPQLSGPPPFGGTVLSHDFIEAALLRRAGWRVRFVPAITGSYEATPETLIAHILRDRRWCQGNLQHLRMLFARGFHPVSRMHLFQGAMAYCASVGWFALLILWVLHGAQAVSAHVYFDAANPLYVSWPEMDRVAKALILALVYGMLIAPKLIGALRFWWSDPWLVGAGGPLRFWASWTVEVVWSVLLAPTMMIQHIVAVFRTLAGFNTGWRPAAQGRPRLSEYLRFHAGELLVGSAMLGVFAAGYLSLWLLPIALCLLLGPVLSAATARRWMSGLLQTPQEVQPPTALRRRDAYLARDPLVLGEEATQIPAPISA